MVQLSFATLAVVAGVLAQTALAIPSEKRAASCSFLIHPHLPTSSYLKLVPSRLAKALTNLRYGRGVTCGGQKEGGTKDAVFILESGATLAQSSGTTTITGGGAKSASDKVVQHNGGGLVKIDSYCVQDFGKLYRHALLAGVNSNFGDVATIDTKTNSYTSLTSVCDTFQGNNKGDEPTTLTKNTANASCKF
ncbi:Pectate lyase [Rhizoctonia solani]|uniref:Pectate lyase n=1 Tax=Rhizoctonia solani TaxID=456999 RepID=A0A8H7I6D6_9AGAM|nr:Pectate lyase [Rhizoctonia solani]